MDKFSHTYFYPGEYLVSLEYYQNYYSQIPEATDKIIIKVAPMAVLISKVGEEKDFFIELANKSDYEADLSKWTLSSGNKIFTFPKNSIILSKKKIILSSQITNLTFGDEKNLKLNISTGEIAFDYGISFIPIVPIEPIVKTKTVIPSVVLAVNTESIIPAESLPMQVDLSASAIKSVSEDQDQTYLFVSGLIAFLGISAGAVYFLRRNKIPANLGKGSDFKILDE